MRGARAKRLSTVEALAHPVRVADAARLSLKELWVFDVDAGEDKEGEGGGYSEHLEGTHTGW